MEQDIDYKQQNISQPRNADQEIFKQEVSEESEEEKDHKVAEQQPRQQQQQQRIKEKNKLSAITMEVMSSSNDEQGVYIICVCFYWRMVCECIDIM